MKCWKVRTDPPVFFRCPIPLNRLEIEKSWLPPPIQLTESKLNKEIYIEHHERHADGERG